MNQPPADMLLIMLGLYVLLPVIIAFGVVRGSLIEIVKAYGIWIVILGLMAWSMRENERGWILLIGMFTTAIGIPLLVLLLKLVGSYRERA